MPSGLEHQRPPQMVVSFLHPLSFLEHRATAHRWKPVDDESERFAGRVCVDRTDTVDHVLSILEVERPGVVDNAKSWASRSPGQEMGHQ
jgi:hypothetical protein